MALIDGDYSDFAYFTFPDPPLEPPAGGWADSDYSGFVQFRFPLEPPAGGWADSDYSGFVQFRFPLPPGASGVFVVTSEDALIPVEIYVASEL